MAAVLGGGGALWMCLLLLCCPATLTLNQTLLQLIKSKSNLSKVAAIIELDDMLRLQFERKPYTAFMPTDEAMDRFTGKKDTRFIDAHLINIPVLIQDIGDTVTTVMTGNPKLYITKMPNGRQTTSDWDNHDYYINNAMVTVANLKAKTKNADPQSLQVLHIIDEVLAPTRVQGSAEVPFRRYPQAADLLTHYRAYGLTDDDSVSVFKDRVEELNEMSVFREGGENTYFITVNQAIQGKSKILDPQVIHGHVIPNQALFTRPASVKEEEIESLAFTDNLKVLLKMVNIASDERTPVYYVESNTVASDSQHAKGTAMARIIKANIPVANGVVHLIDRPLMTTADSIMSYLKEDGGQLSDFYRLFNEYQPDLLTELASRSESEAITLFAPSNYAFSMVKKDSLEKISLNPTKLSELLKLHIVRKRLTTDEIIKSSSTTMFDALTMSQDRKLYFAVNHNDKTKLPVVSVEGAGVNATITTPNIVAQNGVIHIINRILDIPSQTIYEKLASNPTISKTNNLTQQGDFSKRFQSRDEKFTLFVPNNDAWDLVKKEMVSSYKKLFMGDYQYHVHTILERHLIYGKDLSIKALLALTNNRTLDPNTPNYQETLEMMRGKVSFQPRVNMNRNEYILEWNGIVAKVVQSDVECVNGVLHIIDKVLMKREDVTVAAAAPTAAVTTLTTAAVMMVAAMLR